MFGVSSGPLPKDRHRRLSGVQRRVKSVGREGTQGRPREGVHTEVRRGRVNYVQSETSVGQGHLVTGEWSGETERKRSQNKVPQYPWVSPWWVDGLSG